MKIENQVCTLEQAKKLKELGVSGKCVFGYIKIPPNGLPVHHYWKDEKYALINADIVMFVGNGEERWYAPTVAELGVMLPEYCSSWKNGMYGDNQHPMYRYKWLCDIYDDGEVSTQPLGFGDSEAESRAKLLIYLLENHLTTPEEVNQRLNN